MDFDKESFECTLEFNEKITIYLQCLFIEYLSNKHHHALYLCSIFEECFYFFISNTITLLIDVLRLINECPKFETPSLLFFA